MSCSTGLAQPQAAALRGALGLAAGVSDDRFLVSLAALSLLSETAEDEPLLCLSSSAVTLDRMPWWLPGGALAAGVVLLPIGIVTLRRTIRVRRSSA